jgi:hypothetical protein
MNKHSRSLVAPVTAMVAIAVLAMATPAHATLQISLQEAGVNGGAITSVGTAADFSSVSFTGNYGDFTVTIFGGSSDNGASLSDLLQSTTSVTNNSGTSKTLKLYVSQTNYTLPAGSLLNVSSGLGGSVSTGSVGLTGIFQGYADKNNNLNGTGDFTTGAQNATQNGNTFDTGSANGVFSRTNPMYSLTSIVTFALSGGGKANYSSHVNVTPIPEPSTMALGGLGALGLIGYGLRRKARTA